MRKVTEIREEMTILHKEYQAKRWALLSELWQSERLELNLVVSNNKALTESKNASFLPPVSQASL